MSLKAQVLYVKYETGTCGVKHVDSQDAPRHIIIPAALVPTNYRLRRTIICCDFNLTIIIEMCNP